MAEIANGTNHHSVVGVTKTVTTEKVGQKRLNLGLAEMLKGGVIMDVMSVEQAQVAEAAGACAVMALERIPSDIRASGGVARMSDPGLIKSIMKAVSIPVMAKCRIGHFVEAQILQTIGIDFIDESEVLTVADDSQHIRKDSFKTPFVCGARDLGEALRRLDEGAAMMRTKGEAGTGNIVEAIKHIRKINQGIAHLQPLRDDIELQKFAMHERVSLDIVKLTQQYGRLPVVNFAAGGVATPADAAMCMQLGVDGVFVGSGIFKSSEPEKRAKAIVQAVTHYKNPDVVASVSEDIGDAMTGLGQLSQLPQKWSIKEAGI